MTLRVTLAGRVGVEADIGDVAAGALGRPGRLAFAYLVCERHRPVPRDELAEVLWGEELPQSWDQMLRGVAHKLRGVLGAAGLDPNAALTTTGGAFALHLPPGTSVDVEEAAAALEAAEASLAAGYGGAATAHAGAAREVAARQFAPGATGVWAERRHAELADLGLRATEALARAAVATGDWAGAIGYAEEVIAAQALRESAYLVLMDAHAGAGNRGEALRAYERCRTVLVEELGVDPSPPTTAAYLRLLGDTPAPTEAASALPLPSALAPVAGAFIVGRQAEAEALDAAIKRAGVEGRQSVLIGGEPGAGKTTLVAAAARRAHADGARVLYGRADEELGLAYGPFAQALGHYVATAPTAELTAHVAVHGGVLARVVPELTRRLPDAVPPPATDAEADRWALFGAVADALARAGADTPVVVVLDDLHWAGAPTLGLLRHLLAEPSPTALVILGTFRTTESTPALAATLADLRRAPAVERITLEGLDAEEVAAFVAAAGANDDDPSALARALHAHTAGNPFYVGQLLAHLAETAATYRRQGPWSYYNDADGLEVPDGVVEVVQRRLGRLSPEANRALVLASVNGAEFDLEVIEGAEPADAATVLDGLEEAASAALVMELARPGHYRFAHALVRHAIYGRLSAARRARLHLRVAQAIEALPGDDAERLPALAHHFAEAAATGGTAKAAEYALAAAEQAMSQGAAETAVAILERGLGAVEMQPLPDLEHKSDLLLALARTHLFSDEAAPRYEAAMKAAEVARQMGSAERLAEAVSASVPEQRGDASFQALVQEALATLGHGSPRLRSSLLGYVAAGRIPTDEVAERMSAEALALARTTGDPDTLGPALLMRARLLMGTPFAAELLNITDELVTAAPPHAWHGWRHGHRLRAIARLISADRAGFDADVDDLEQQGQKPLHWMSRVAAGQYRVTQAFLDGRFADVEALAPEVAGIRPNERERDAYWSMQRAMAHWEQGRMADASALLRSAMAGRPDRPMPLFRGLLVLAELEHGQEDRARGGLLQLVGVLAQRPPGWNIPLLVPISELAVAVGDSDAAAMAYEWFAGHSGLVAVSEILICGGSVDRHLGMLATVLGRWELAEAHFQTALRVDARLSSPPLLARTRHSYARLLIERPAGDRHQARALATAAAETARGFGMARLAADARDLLRRL